MTIQMQAPFSNGPTTLPQPSGATYIAVNGVIAAQGEDVDLLIKAGFQVMAGELWPQNRIVRMKVPTIGAWPSTGTVTFPDGATAAVVAGIAKIPQAWINWVANYGWQLV